MLAISCHLYLFSFFLLLGWLKEEKSLPAPSTQKYILTSTEFCENIRPQIYYSPAYDLFEAFPNFLRVYTFLCIWIHCWVLDFMGELNNIAYNYIL